MAKTKDELINRIRMRHIRCFNAVALHKSATAAAKHINISQPALSRSLTELQDIIGQTLFTRTGRGLALTEAGQGLYRYLDMAMSQVEVGALRASGLLKQSRVSVGMLPNVARTLAVEAAATFKSQEPEVNLELHWAGVPELIGKLHRNEIDFLLGRLLSLEHLEGVSFDHLYTESIIFAAHKDHPLASDPDEVTLQDLDDELMVVPLPNTIVRREMEKFLTARGVTEFANQIETVSFEFMRSFLSMGTAVACIPLGAVREEISDGRFVDLGIHGEELVSSVGMTSVSDRPLSAQAHAFAEHVRAAARQYS